MDKDWVDRWLPSLLASLAGSDSSAWAMFEPTPRFYRTLETGEDKDLVRAAGEIARHLGMCVPPAVSYQWGIRMGVGEAGKFHCRGEGDSRIEVPVFYAGRPHALGAILAHEMTHELLLRKGVGPDDPQEREAVTDLASIVAGLGKLALNGAVVELTAAGDAKTTLGYLPEGTKGYAYNQLTRVHKVPAALARSNLTENALGVIEAARLPAGN